MKIVIPTYDRYNNFKTLPFLEKNNIDKNNIYIFVADEEQKNKYTNVIGNEYNIIIGVLGLVNQRTYITNYFDDEEILICMDDDIEDLIHYDNINFIDWLNDCINYLSESKYGLLSISPSTNPFFHNEKNKKNSNTYNIGNYYCIGAFFILKNDKELLLDNSIILEDLERSLLYKKKYISNIIYNKVLIKTKYFAKGGLSSQRNKNNYLNSVNKLIYEYPSLLKFNYKKLQLDKYYLFPNLSLVKNVSNNILNVIQLPKIDSSELSVLYCLLENTYIRPKTNYNNRRNFPNHHQALTFGLTRARFNNRLNKKLVDISNDSKKYSEIYDEILRIGNIYCPFNFQSIHVNKNVVCPKHKDDKNKQMSMLLSFGDYTGCNIVVEDKIYDADCNPIIFNGSKLEHWNTDDLIGTKYSLVFF